MDIDHKRQRLKGIVLNILKENPQGIQRHNLWNYVAKKMGRSPCAKDYGFVKMAQMFPVLKHLYLEFQVGKDIFIKLRPSAAVDSETRTDDDDDDHFAKPTESYASAKSQSTPSCKSSKSDSFLSLTVPEEEKVTVKGPSKLAMLKEKILRLLEKEQKIVKGQFWRHFQLEYHDTPIGKDFGVRKMADVLAQMNDVIEERKIKGTDYLILRSTTSRPPAEGAAPQWGKGAATVPGVGRTSHDAESSSSESTTDSDSDCFIDEIRTHLFNLKSKTGMPAANMSPQCLSGQNAHMSGMNMMSKGHPIAPIPPQPLMAHPGSVKQGFPQALPPRQPMLFSSVIPVPLLIPVPSGSQANIPAEGPSHVLSQPSTSQEGNVREIRDKDQSGNRANSQRERVSKSRKSDRLQTCDIEITRVPVGRGPPSRDMLNNIAKDCIEKLSNVNEHVSSERVEQLICQRFGVRHVQDLRVVRHVDQIPAVHEHGRLMCKVNMYVQAFVKARSLCTLYELSECLREFTVDRDDFETLRLGPLQRFPIIYDLFKFPHDEEIPEITTIDILEHLRDYLTTNSKWTERIEMEPVMSYLVDVYNMDSAYQLGVRIRSLPLAVQMLKKSQRDAAGERRNVTDIFKEKFRKDLETSLQKFRATVLQRGDSGESEVRKHYLDISPVDAIAEIFNKFHVLLTLDQPTKAKMRHQRQMESSVNGFLSLMSCDKIASMLLHLAICVSDTTLQESAMELLAPPTPPSQESGSKEDNSAVRQRPSRATVFENLKKYIERCLDRGSLRLSDLDRIEEKILESFSYPTFQMMGFGRFLHFLSTDTEAKTLLEEAGGTVFGSAGSSTDSDAPYRPQMSDVLETVRQSRSAGITQPDLVESVLQDQFQVTNVKQLGYGNIGRLVTAADRPGKHKSSEYLVLYEAAIAGKTVCSTQSPRKVGILGDQSRNSALACLHNCPLLEDLALWSHWSLVFEPQHGHLKDFIQKYGGVTTQVIDGGTKKVSTDVVALETKPGTLLKLVTQTSPEKFQNALSNMDVIGSCGHLVSMVMMNKGLENTPTALLANHMKTALFTMHASSQTPGGPPGVSDTAVLFVLACLIKLPFRLCVAVADQLFLEPLGQVVGATKSKALLISSCSDMSQLRHLERLGCLLGIQEWTVSLLDKCQPPADSITQVYSEADIKELMEQGEELIVGSDSEVESESESESDEDDIDSILSDDIPAEASLDKEDASTLKTNKEESDQLNQKEANSVENKSDEEGSTESETGSEEEDDEASDDTPESEQSKCQLIIEQIRREEFGVGVELNEDGQKLMQVQQERLGRSLDRLSKDLYSKDTHFVLELVQNADDNSYPEDVLNNEKDVCPAVRFKMDSDGVTVLNNECGFQEKNIRALCDVGRSTKGKHKFGYIGQKGIGFKSVFRVTDCPEVHSNGFHLKFDVKSGPTGYILPQWVETDEDIQEGWPTKIYLPLKEEMVLQTRSLAARFNDIHPSLLLFLHRLREITVENLIECNVLRMRRRDLGDGIVEIDHGHSVDRWLVVRKLLDASKISKQAKSGVDVESTEIALAFPLHPKNSKLKMNVLPSKQPVFAFLPLRTYGFRFIIQGDFDVPSSREDVDRDSPWNQWLRNEIHTLFIEALDVFKCHRNFSSMDALSAFLQFVPMEDEILDFFRPVANQILGKLRAKECLPIQTSKKGVIQLKIPSQTVIVKDALIREVVPPDVLEKNLNLYYLHGDVAMNMTSSLAQSLGVECITVDHLLQIGKSLVLSWETESVGTPVKVLTIAKWLACLYRGIDEFQENESVYDRLKKTRIIPLSTGQLIALDEMTVFLPPVDDETHSQHGKSDPVSDLYCDLSMVHVGLMTTPDKEINSQVQKLLQRVGVKQLSPDDIIHHHILPSLKSDTWETKSRDVLISYLVYIKYQGEKQPSLINMAELRSLARVVTNHGIKKPADDAVHFTTAYGNKLDLPRYLPGYDWILLDAVYLNQATSSLDIQRWHEFFLQLGITDFLSVTTNEVHLTKESMADSPWAPLKHMWPESSSGYHITDYQCEEFDALVNKNKFPAQEKLIPQLRILFEILDKDWDSKYSKFQNVQVKDGNGHVLKDTESSFSIALTSSKWIPALQLSIEDFPGGGLRLMEYVTVMQPFLLYIRDPVLEQILGHMVYYLAVSANRQSTFTRYLRIKSKIETKVVKDLLIEWGKRDPASPTTPRSFRSSLGHFKAVYLYLHENLVPKEYQDLYHDNNVIFVPDVLVPDGNPVNFVKGKMLGRQEVWWNDPSGLFSRYQNLLVEYHSDLANKYVICHYYQELAEIFTNSARIEVGPSLSHFAELVLLIVSVNSPSEKNILSDVLSVFAKIGAEAAKVRDERGTHTDIAVRNVYVQAAVKKLAKQKIFPTKKYEWVGVDDKPMIADNRELEKMFVDEKNVHFLQLEEQETRGHLKGRVRKGRDRPKHDLQSVITFLEQFKIARLSSCVHTESITLMTAQCPKLQMYAHRLVPHIQCFLSSQYPDVYQTLMEQNVIANMKVFSFQQVSSLEVIYTLTNIPEPRVIRPEKCMRTGNQFVFHKNHIGSYTDINREIAKYFSCGDDECFKFLRNFLGDLTPILDDELSIRDVLEKHDVEEMPENEELWEVPPPLFPEPVVQPNHPSHDKVKENDSDVAVVQTEGGIRAWPPKASSSGPDLSIQTNKSSARPTEGKMWPPPKPPEYHQQVKNLPANVRVIHVAEGSTDESKKAGETVSNTTSGKTEQREGTVIRYLSGSDARVAGGSEDKVKPEEGAGTVKRKLSATAVVIEAKRPELEEETSAEGEAPATQDIPSQTSTGESQGQTTPATKRRHGFSESEVASSPKRAVFFKAGDPTWSDSASELVYEELMTGTNLPTPELVLADKDERMEVPEIGRWGEQLVRDYLVQKMNRGTDIVDVRWVNETEESGLPYDFEIVCLLDDNPEPKKMYVEVKSTLLEEKKHFEISSREVNFAHNNKECYQIYRIFNAGDTKKVKLLCIDNVALKMDQGKLKVYMYI